MSKSANKVLSKRNLSAALLILALVAAVAIQIMAAGQPVDDERPSSASTTPEGRRAFKELLAQFSGETAVESWDKPPGGLPRGRGILILPQVPIGFSNLAVREEGEEEEDGGFQMPVDGDLFETAPTFAEHHPRHYARFVHQGGTLIAPASEDMLRWLEASAEIEPVAAVTRSTSIFATGEEVEERDEAEEDAPSELFRWSEESGDPAPLQISWRDADGLRLDLSDPSPFASAAEVPYGLLFAVEEESGPERLTEAGSLRVVVLPLGEGNVLLVSDLDVFDNQRLGEEHHAYFAVRLLRLAEGLALPGVAGTNPILFDEYSLGGWTPPGTTSLLFGGAVGWITLHLLLLVVFLVWRQAWVGPFPRDPERLEGLAPLERTRAEGGLLLRAQRYDLLAQHLFDGVFHRLERRLLRTTTERPTASDGEAVPFAVLNTWRKERMDRVRAAVHDWNPNADLPALSAPHEVQRRQDLHLLQESLQVWERTVQRRLDLQLKPESQRSEATPDEKERAFSGATTS